MEAPYQRFANQNCIDATSVLFFTCLMIFACLYTEKLDVLFLPLV
ncbi:hypothetical protein CAL7102_07559 [Dulcicalothrix desertica PCC 7102]|nr:hypothetical protein CAL7102_07559 [Dulcicalothrix desertica PCC 7102]